MERDELDKMQVHMQSNVMDPKKKKKNQNLTVTDPRKKFFFKLIQSHFQCKTLRPALKRQTFPKGYARDMILSRFPTHLSHQNVAWQPSTKCYIAK